MNEGTWMELLDELVEGTVGGRVRWRPTDSVGAFAAAFDGASVVVRGVPSDVGFAQSVRTIAARAFGDNTVEVRDPGGNLVAALGTSISTVGLAATTMLGEEQIVTVPSEYLQRRVDELVGAIAAASLSGESAARKIIDQLRKRT